MAYRQMEARQAPKFSFTEKLFLSTKKRDRALGQAILLTKTLAKTIGAILLVIGALTLFMGGCGFLLYAISCGVEYLIGLKYITRTQAMIGMLVMICGMFLVPGIMNGIRAMMNENNTRMKRAIDDKLTTGREQK